MRLQIFSDLHLRFPGAKGIPRLAPGAAVVVAAGDICEGLVRAVEALRAGLPSTEVVAVAGNHEFYGHCLPEELEAGRARARQLGVHLLENNTVTFGDFRVIGATGWTDYELFGPDLCAPAMRAAADAMQDHRLIKWRRKPWYRFRPEEARALHLQSRAYIDAELAKAHDGPTMVITHHAPTIEAVAPEFQRSLTSAAFASEMMPLVDRHQPKWWVSGHTHVSMDLGRGRTRLVSNPCGYGDENPSFDPLLTIDTDHA